MPFKTATEVGGNPLPLRVNIWGEQKVGKTMFALSFPRPIHYFNFDRPVQDLLHTHPELAQDVYLADYFLDPNATPEDGERLLERFVEEWREACLVPGGTVVLDTGTDAKRIVTYVKVDQKLKEKIKRAAARASAQNKPFDPDTVEVRMNDYQDRNQLMRAILDLPHLAQKNAVYVWKAKELYSGNGAPTGQFAGDLYKDAPYVAQATLARKRVGIGKNVQYVTVIEDNTFVPEMNGEQFTEDVLANYDDLRGLLV